MIFYTQARHFWPTHTCFLLLLFTSQAEPSQGALGESNPVAWSSRHHGINLHTWGISQDQGPWARTGLPHALSRELSGGHAWHTALSLRLPIARATTQALLSHLGASHEAAVPYRVISLAQEDGQYAAAYEIYLSFWWAAEPPGYTLQSRQKDQDFYAFYTDNGQEAGAIAAYGLRPKRFMSKWRKWYGPLKDYFPGLGTSCAHGSPHTIVDQEGLSEESLERGYLEAVFLLRQLARKERELNYLLSRLSLPKERLAFHLPDLPAYFQAHFVRGDFFPEEQPGAAPTKHLLEDFLWTVFSPQPLTLAKAHQLVMAPPPETFEPIRAHLLERLRAAKKDCLEEQAKQRMQVQEQAKALKRSGISPRALLAERMIQGQLPESLSFPFLLGEEEEQLRAMLAAMQALVTDSEPYNYYGTKNCSEVPLRVLAAGFTGRFKAGEEIVKQRLAGGWLPANPGLAHTIAIQLKKAMAKEVERRRQAGDKRQAIPEGWKLTHRRCLALFFGISLAGSLLGKPSSRPLQLNKQAGEWEPLRIFIFFLVIKGLNRWLFTS